ncbi:MAG: 50S ribosomal protein L10 [Ardenticatenaceae bacterium]|nr:50S ribosomal protein L10 [Anaerolineales bacterium]MCB8918483.1 50S ribosomal protein L10 [Ardenticatenaceae bacterium]
MAITKARREELLAQYIDLLNQSQAVFLTEFSAMEVKRMEELRAEVRKADGRFYVTKNTLLRIALQETGRPVPEDLLKGQTSASFALGEAPALAKAISEFAKSEEKLTLKGGILNKDLLTSEQVEALAQLPSLDQLRAQIIGLISAPAQNITSAVANGVRQLINVLDAYAKKDDNAEAVEAAA